MSYGKLLILGKDISDPFIEYPIDKTSVMIGRDNSCDIRITNKEISRRHAEIFVEIGNEKSVLLNSMGREPVSVNGRPVTSPIQLRTGDKVEIHLEGRSRAFYYQAEDETVVLPVKQPLGEMNSPAKQPTSLKKAEGNAPSSAKKSTRRTPAKKMAPPPPPPLPKANTAGNATAVPAPRPALAAALQDAIKAGVQLRKVDDSSAPKEEAVENNAMAVDDEPASKPVVVAQAAFVPNPDDLLKMKAGLRKTAAEEEQEGQEQEPKEEEMKDVEEAKSPVQQAIEAATAEEEAQEPVGTAAGGVPFSTATKKARKNVRFEAAEPEVLQFMGTPEGAANDATLTIRLRKGDLEQIVNIDDNTFAFSDWALGTMAPVDEEQALPDTVVSKRSRRASEAPSAGGSIAKPTPMRTTRSASKTAPEAEPFSAAKAGTPAPTGVKAPATTPATAGAATSAARAAFVASKNGTIDPTTLANKLAELAQDNDVTFELPFDLFGATPFASSKKTIAITVTPKSTKKNMSTAKRSSTRTRSSMGAQAASVAAGGDVDHQPSPAVPLTEEQQPVPEKQQQEMLEATMQIPATIVEALQQAAAIQPVAEEEEQGVEIDEEEGIQQPATTEEQAMEIQEEAEEEEEEAKNKEQAQPAELNTANKSGVAPASAPKSTARAGSAAAPRRSISRTPGTKIAIIERGTPASVRGASSVKPASRTLSSAAKMLPQPTPQHMALSTMAVMEHVGEEEEEKDVEDTKMDIAAGLEAESQDKEEIVVQGDVDMMMPDGGDGEQQEAAEAEEGKDEEMVKGVEEALVDAPEEDVMDESEQEEEGDKAENNVVVPGQNAGDNVPVATYRKAMLTARVHRSNSIQLTNQLRAAHTRIARLHKAAKGLALTLKKERGMRLELQKALQDIVANREAAAEEEVEEDEEMMIEQQDVDMNNEDTADADQPEGPRVVVVGYHPSPQPVTTELAGSVVVVRPNGTTNATTIKTTATPAASLPKTAAKKTPATSRTRPSSSMRKTPATVAKTPGGTVTVVDNVEIPEWVFEAAAEEEVNAEVAADLAVIEQDTTQQIEEAPAPVSPELGVYNDVEEAQAEEEPAPIVMKLVVEEETVVEQEEEDNDDEEEEEDVCHLCGETEAGDILLLCDSCDNACHLGCCKPVLKKVPKGDWFCVECVQKQKAEEEKAAGAKKGRGRPAAKAEKEEPAAKRGKKAAAAAPKEEAKPKGGRGKTAAAPAAAPKRGRAAAAKEDKAAPAAKKSRAAAPAPAAGRKSTRQR